MRIRHTAALALVVVAAAVPTASAMPAVESGPPAATRQAIASQPGASRFDASLSGREWEQARSAPVIRLVRPDSNGFDWASAGIGAGALFALLLLGAVASSTFRRGRKPLTPAA